jgi:glycosyltransferase involved in cell wall biosynthesis
MKVLQVIASANPGVGGPAVTVTRLAAALSALGVESTLATLDYAALGARPAQKGVRDESMPAGALTRALRGWSPKFSRKLAELAGGGIDLVHNHGLWMFPNVYARRAARARRIPLVVSPRGMLDAWSLRRSRIRKAVAWRVFERENLASANLFHATSAAEANAIRAASLAQPIAVIPNGVDIPDAGDLPGRDILEGRFAELRGKQWLLFLSRLHPKKGIAGLLRAWRSLAAHRSAWQLVLAGPDLDGHGVEMEDLAAQLGVRDHVTFTGLLSGNAKACALANAGLLVLPTHSENFGVVVAEALAHGTPALTTRAAPWQELEEARCGWWIEDREDALQAALQEAMALAPLQRREMGGRGRTLVAQRYSWDRVGRDMKSAYEWIRGAGAKPAFVR